MDAENTVLIEQTVSNDPGDQTANRYRFQWACAAMCCCQMLNPELKIAEIFCEHHEDILIKHTDHTYTGLQIKTRASNQPIWSATDPVIISSFARFCSLDLKYGSQFSAFIFATNHPMQSTKNGRDVIFLLGQIRENTPYSSQASIVHTFVKKVAKEASIDEEQVYASLKKCIVQQDLPHLKDISIRLMSNLATDWEGAKTGSYNEVQQAAEALISECASASSLAIQDFLPLYFDSVESNNTSLAIIEHKRFDRERTLQILNKGFNGELPLFRDLDTVIPCSFDKDLLRKKMDAGGFSITSTFYAEDLRDSADYAGYQLIQKYGSSLGKQKYDELTLKVHRDAAEAFEMEKDNQDPFGAKMLARMRSSLKKRVDSGENLYGFTPDHLEGLAYTLTSQCKVAWSLKRPWEEE